MLEAKAEENARAASAAEEAEKPEAAAALDSVAQVAEPATPQPQDATKIQEPIPLPPPPSTTVPGGAAAAETPVEEHSATLAPGEASQMAAQTGTTTSTSE